MPLIILDGPEKAGKSTLVKRLEQWYGARSVHWGPVTDHSRYVEPLARDVLDKGLVVWDRCWASECVYGPLLDRQHRDESDPWLMEWLYSRAVDTVGVKAVLLPVSTEETRERRDDTDLPVDPDMEAASYRSYAERFGWEVLINDYTPRSVEDNADYLALKAWTTVASVTLRPPQYCGPTNPRILVVGEEGNPDNPHKPRGRWLPFTSRYTTMFGRAMGDPALTCGWVNFPRVSLRTLRSPRIVVACGGRVYSRLLRSGWLQPHQKLIKVNHPSWMYRWGRATPLVGGYEDSLRSIFLL